MTQITPTQQSETAGRSAAAKLQAFLDGLTPDEQQAIELGLRRLVVQADESTGDAAGYALPGLSSAFWWAQFPIYIAGEPVRLRREP
jgi:hypothetical protein